MPGDIGNLRPDDHAALVAQVVKELVVLIVRQADGVRAQLADQIHVLAVMLRQQRVADAPAVLMARDAAQRIRFAVEEEAALRVDLKGAAAKARAHAVEHLPFREQVGLSGVQVRILSPVPQVGVGDLRLKDGLPGGAGLLRDDFALCVAQRKAQLLPLLRVREPDLGLDARILPVHDRGHGDARPAIAAEVKV